MNEESLPTGTMLIRQHIACEPPAIYEDEMLAWGAELHRVRPDEAEPLPDWREFDGIVPMGGAMGADEDDRLPWLRTEKRLIAEAVQSNTPFWGVCVGVQLLAASLGGTVLRGPEPDVGLLTARRTDSAGEDPVFSLLPDEFPTLQWHSDTYELPKGSTQLARSDAYEQQASW